MRRDETMTEWPLNSRPGDLPLEVPTDVLTSYHYFKDVDLGAMQRWGLRIIGDSGAFSALTSGNPIDREEFHAWADRWRDALLWVAALDVIGDPEATYTNWQAAKADGLDLVPTIHYGGGTDLLDRYAEAGQDLIGLGGMVPYGSEPARLMRWCLMMHRHAKAHHPHVRFHGWGISHPLLMDNLPWWSADSSGFASAFRFGSLRLFDPRKGRYTIVALNGRDIAAHRHLLRKHYGLEDWRSVAVSTPATRRAVGRLAIKAIQMYAAWLQSRQQVSPPASLVPKLGRWVGADQGPAAAAALGSSMMQGTIALSPHDTYGPRNAAVIQASNDAGRSLNPAGDQAIGPRQAAAFGNSVSTQTQIVSPGDSVTPPSAEGPRAPVVMGYGNTQYPFSPEDGPAPSAGPRQAAVLGGSKSSQVDLCVSPSDTALPRTGPSLVIANTNVEFIDP